MRDSYGTYDGRKPEPPYPTEQERREQGMKLEMKQRMEQVTDYKKLADELRETEHDQLFPPALARLLKSAADAVAALLAERDSALDDHARRYNELLVSGQENQRLRAKLVKATEASTNLADKLDAIIASSEYRSVFTLAMIHGAPYDGPTFELELKELRAALAAIKETTNG